jgi:hypothetical protein
MHGIFFFLHCRACNSELRVNITAFILIYSSEETDVSMTVFKGLEYSIFKLILIMPMPNLEHLSGDRDY